MAMHVPVTSAPREQGVEMGGMLVTPQLQVQGETLSQGWKVIDQDTHTHTHCMHTRTHAYIQGMMCQ